MKQKRLIMLLLSVMLAITASAVERTMTEALSLVQEQFNNEEVDIYRLTDVSASQPKCANPYGDTVTESFKINQ